MLSELQTEVTLPDQPEHLAVHSLHQVLSTRVFVSSMPPCDYKLSQQMEALQLHTLALEAGMGYPSLYLLHTTLGKTSADSRLHVCVSGCFLIYSFIRVPMRLF